MTRLCFALVALVSLGTVGCGSSTSTPSSPDLAMTTSPGGDMSLYSLCGHPGDTGNSKGVGKFCMDTTMCSGQTAGVCSTLMSIPQGPVYFCTMLCDPNATTSTCGEGATCTCLNPPACGCVPDLCRIGLFG